MKFRRIEVRAIAAWIATLAAAGLGIYLLMIPPVLGIADNGDFGRVMGITGFAYPDPLEQYEDRYFGNAHRVFAYGGYDGAGYVSSHVLLVAATGFIARLFSWYHFDIRWLGAVYLLLFCSAVYLLVRHVPLPRRTSGAASAMTAGVLAILLLFVFGDVGYMAYFQSFFGEPYALVGMLLLAASTLALASRERPSGWLLLLFAAAELAVTTAKTQNAPLGLAFALLAWRMMRLHGDDRRWRRQTGATAILLVLSAIVIFVGAPDRLRHINLYQSIFFGVLKDTPDLPRDLRELGIPDRYAALAGTNYFMKDTAIPQNDPTLRREVLEKLSHKDIALYYARHPSRFMQKLEKAAANGVFIRPYYLGNYDREAGMPRGAISHAFSAWSEWKVHRMPHTLGWFGGFYVLYFAGAALCWFRTASRRLRLMLEMLAVVGLAGAFALTVPILGDGEADLGKHLFMFNVCFDMMVIGAAATAVAWASVRFAGRKAA